MKNEIEFKFGDYAIIEQKRHGVPNEMFVHKVVGQLRSNTWVDVPVRVPATETLHGEMEDICLCICCGIDETEVRRYRVKDMRRHSSVSLVADEKRGSTITQQAVNELIQSLESAGELSIKERKYLELAREFKRLAAESVAMKSNAIKARRVIMSSKFDYWSDRVELFEVVRLIIETTATDRIVAGIKADGRAEGINFAAGRLAAAFNHGFVDKPMAEVFDAVRMILTAKEDLANNPAEDGLSGEYAEKSLTEWEAALREGADK